MANFSPSTYVLLKAYTDKAVTEQIGSMASGMTFKGTVPTVADLPSTHNNGDLWIVQDSDTSTPGEQGCKAVWDATTAKWILFDEIPTKVSQLDNDEFFLSQKVSGTSYVDNIHIDGTVTTHTATTSNPHEYIISEIQLDRGTSTSLATTVPKLGEPIFEYDSVAKTYKLKIGDGSTKYASLPYIGNQYELSADERSMHLQGSQLQIYGFAAATNGYVPRKVSGLLQWVKANDIFKFVAGNAVEITETVSTDNTFTEKFDVKYDNATVKINSNNQLEVPIDNDTISLVSGKLEARQPVAGDVSVKIEDVAGTTKVYGNYKAGTNISFETKADGVYISSTGGGSGNIEAGKAIKFTTNSSTGATVINADYDAGDYINITTDSSTGRTSINVDPTAVVNTFRPVRLNGTQILDTDPANGYIEFQSTTGAYAVKANGVGKSGGKAVEFEISNRNILQAAEQSSSKKILKDLSNNTIILDCGGANLAN